jgi:hypothetical protein
MPSQCKALYDREMKTIFATAVQYPVRLAAAMRRNDLPRQHKECYAQALRAWTGLYEPFSRPSTRPGSLACHYKPIVCVRTSSAGLPLGNDILKAGYSLAARLHMRS